MGNYLRIIISVIFLGLFFFLFREKLPEMMRVIWMADKHYLAVGLISSVVACGIMGVRLKSIVSALKLKFTFKDSVAVTFVGYFFNNFLPTAVGGDLVKTYCLMRKTSDKTMSVAAIFSDRLYGLLMFLTIPSLTVVFVRHTLDIAIVRAVYFALGCGIVCIVSIIFYPKIAKLRQLQALSNRFKIVRAIIRIYESLNLIAAKPQTALLVCGLSLAGQLLSIGSIYWIIKALIPSIEFGIIAYLLMVVPIVNLISMIPSLGGLGVREVGFVTFLTQIMNKEEALAVAAIFFSYLLFLSLIGGIIYVFRQDMHFDFSFMKKPKISKSVRGVA